MKKRILISIISILILFLHVHIMGQEIQSPFLYEKGNTSITFGGFVKLNTSVDFNGSIPSNDFRNSLMSVPSRWNNNSRFVLDPSHTRIRLKVIQKTEALGDIEFYVETDFRGTSNALRLRQAYVSFKGFIMGQTWGFMNDPLALAPSVDIQGVNSRTFFRTPLIGYRLNLDNNFSLGISLELPSVKMSTQPGVISTNQTLPDIPLYIQYKGEGGHIKLAGVVRSMSYAVVDSESIEKELGLGAQISGSLRAAKNISFYSQAIYGKGVARYINDLSLLNLDLVPANSNSAQQSVQMYGISVGAKATLNENLFLSTSVSTAGLANKDDYYAYNEYFTGNYYSASLFWTGVKNMTIAGTYIHGSRKNMNSTKGDANRIQLMVMYKW